MNHIQVQGTFNRYSLPFSHILLRKRFKVRDRLVCRKINIDRPCEGI